MLWFTKLLDRTPDAGPKIVTGRELTFAELYLIVGVACVVIVGVVVLFRTFFPGAAATCGTPIRKDWERRVRRGAGHRRACAQDRPLPPVVRSRLRR